MVLHWFMICDDQDLEKGIANINGEAEAQLRRRNSVKKIVKEKNLPLQLPLLPISQRDVVTTTKTLHTPNSSSSEPAAMEATPAASRSPSHAKHESVPSHI